MMNWWSFYTSYSSAIFLSEGSGDSEEVEFNPLLQNNKLSYGVISFNTNCIIAAAEDDDALSCSGENLDEDFVGNGVVDHDHHQGLKIDSSRRGGKQVASEVALEVCMSPENADDGDRIDMINSVDESCGGAVWDENMDDRLFWEACLEVGY